MMPTKFNSRQIQSPPKLSGPWHERVQSGVTSVGLSFDGMMNNMQGEQCSAFDCKNDGEVTVKEVVTKNSIWIVC